jgi:hypothetical protein
MVFYQVPFVAETDFAADGAHLTFRLGYENQTMDVHPSRLVNYGPLESESRPECLSNTTDLLLNPEIVRTPPTAVFVDVYNVRIYSKVLTDNEIRSLAVGSGK